MLAKKSIFISCVLFFAVLRLSAQTETNYLVNEPIDISPDFRNFSNSYFLADSLASFNPATGSGTLKWRQSRFVRRMAFNNELAVLRRNPTVVFPETEYAIDPELPFSIQFTSPRSFRIRIKTGFVTHEEKDTLMLVKEPISDNSWKYTKVKDGYLYTNVAGSVLIKPYPWHIEIRDVNGKLLTSTDHDLDNEATFTPVMPFAFVRRAADLSRSISASFTLSPGEKIFGLRRIIHQT
jgi:alpha-D-xyloside xylohydrolase